MEENGLVRSGNGVLRSALPGGLGGIALVVVGHPFDLVKVRLQTAPFPSVTSCLQTILRTGGPAGFYQGVTAPLLGVIPVFAFYYGVYKKVRDELHVNPGSLCNFKFSDGLATSVAAATAALTTTCISCPAERIKILLQCALPYQNLTIVSTVKSLWQAGGLQSLYRGFSIMLARELPSSVIYFGVYEALRKKLNTDNSHTLASFVGMSLAGGCAGAASWLSTAPLDTLKSVYQADLNVKPTPILYVARQLVPTLGVDVALTKRIRLTLGAFYRGWAPAIMRTFPANAACFAAIEAAHVLLRDKNSLLPSTSSTSLT